MKKIIYLIATLTMSWVASNAQSAISTKNLGVDSVTGLQQRIEVWQIAIDSKAEVVTIVYQIKTLAPNGSVVATTENRTFTRYNEPGKMNFNILRDSNVGNAIISMINADLAEYPNLSQ